MPIYTRAEWGAKHPSVRPGVWRRGELVVHTEAGAHVNTDTDNPATPVDEGWGLADFFKRLRNIEAFHVGTRGWDAIAYSFLVDPVRGWAAEGRGWGQNGTHTQQGRNSTAYAICFLGNGDNQAVTDDGWKGAELVVRDGLARGALTAKYAVNGHRNYAQKSCPGNLIYPHIGRLRGLTLVITPPAPEPPPEEDDDMKPFLAQAEGTPVFLIFPNGQAEAGVPTEAALADAKRIYGDKIEKVSKDFLRLHGVSV